MPHNERTMCLAKDVLLLSSPDKTTHFTPRDGNTVTSFKHIQLNCIDLFILTLLYYNNINFIGLWCNGLELTIIVLKVIPLGPMNLILLVAYHRV